MTLRIFLIQLFVALSLTFGSTAIIFVPTAKIFRIDKLKQSIILASILFAIILWIVLNFVAIQVTQI